MEINSLPQCLQLVYLQQMCPHSQRRSTSDCAVVMLWLIINCRWYFLLSYYIDNIAHVEIVICIETWRLLWSWKESGTCWL